MTTEGPQEIQIRRVKGCHVPPNTVTVTRPSVFGNPFKGDAFRLAGHKGTDAEMAALAVDAYRRWLNGELLVPGTEAQRNRVLAMLPQLRGKNLACFCPLGSPCHRTVLLEMANKEGEPE